jgi:alpha-L-rhamnosidase
MGQLRPTGLRTEYLESPRGITASQPRLSWRLSGDGHNRRQTAYQIKVATIPKSLKQDNAELWDSGKVISDLQPAIRYAGPALASGATAYWQVRIWDESDTPSAWSNTHFWQHGLSASDWSAASWIAHPTPKDAGELSQPVAMLRHQFDLPSKPVSATLYASALGLYEIQLNGQVVGDRVLTPGWSDYNHRVMYQAYDVTN